MRLKGVMICVTAVSLILGGCGDKVQQKEEVTVSADTAKEEDREAVKEENSYYEMEIPADESETLTEAAVQAAKSYQDLLVQAKKNSGKEEVLSMDTVAALVKKMGSQGMLPWITGTGRTWRTTSLRRSFWQVRRKKRMQLFPSTAFTMTEEWKR